MAFRFRKNCERSDGILQRFLNPTEDTLNDEYIEHTDDGDILVTTHASRPSKDSRVVVSSDCGLYEYRPPVGLNVKLVKNETVTRTVRTPATARRSGGSGSTSATTTATPSEHTIYLKSEPLNDDDSLDENDCIDVLYDMDSNFDDSCDADRTMDPLRNASTKSVVNVTAANEQNSKLMQIKPVRTNKIRLGYTSSNKGKNSALASSTKSATTSAASMVSAATTVKGKSKENGSKENATTNRSPKSKTNAKGEPKQPKECEICGNTYTYQHALERYAKLDGYFVFPP